VTFHGCTLAALFLPSLLLTTPTAATQPAAPPERPGPKNQSRPAQESPVTKAGTLRLDDLWKDRTDTPFEVRIAGAGTDSFLEPARCGYWEWSYGRRHGGKLASFTVAYHSEAPLLLDVEGKTVEVSAQMIRPFLKPHFERTYAAGDPAAPEIVRGRMKQEKVGLYAVEYCLEVGKTYYAKVREYRVHLPPDPGGVSPWQLQRVLVISDRPFVKGEPKGEVTPGFRNWTF
jgi:hypothetical protein